MKERRILAGYGDLVKRASMDLRSAPNPDRLATVGRYDLRRVDLAAATLADRVPELGPERLVQLVALGNDGVERPANLLVGDAALDSGTPTTRREVHVQTEQSLALESVATVRRHHQTRVRRELDRYDQSERRRVWIAIHNACQDTTTDHVDNLVVARDMERPNHSTSRERESDPPDPVLLCENSVLEILFVIEELLVPAPMVRIPTERDQE